MREQEVIETERQKVLILDDDPDIREGLAALILAEGYNPITIGTGEEALPTLREEQISLLLLDVMLPGMSGFDVLKAVREDPEYQNTPIIMITAEDTDQQVLYGYEFGADYYIPKPFNAKQLRYGLNLCMDIS